jgi:hypothetical protein
MNLSDLKDHDLTSVVDFLSFKLKNRVDDFRNLIIDVAYILSSIDCLK